MNAISKIIFDRLAAGGGVFLPGVGSLRVEREPAQFASHREISPPANRVVYSSGQAPGLESVADILARTGQMTIVAAELQYAGWLEDIGGGEGAAEINGVGVVKKGRLYPSVELYDRLNPSGAAHIVLRRKGRLRWLFILMGVIAAAALFWFAAAHCDNFPDLLRSAWQQDDIKSIVVVPGEEISPQELFPEEAAEETAAGISAAEEGTDDMAISTEIAGNETLVKNSVASERATALRDDKPASKAGAENVAIKQQEAPQNQKAQTSAPMTASAPTYHLVVGVFSVRANAEKCAASDPLKIGRTNYKIYPYKGDKYLVSAFESASRAAADARRRELSPHKPDIWIYEK